MLWKNFNHFLRQNLQQFKVSKKQFYYLKLNKIKNLTVGIKKVNYIRKRRKIIRF